MKKFYIFTLIIFGILASVNGVLSYSDCSKYGLFAYPDGFGYCKCMTGYVWSTDLFGKKTCVDGDIYCHEKYGYHSSYDYLSGGCKCNRGYFLKSKIYGGYECVSGEDLCKDKYGINADYDFLTDSCKCDYGYIFGEGILGKTQCISYDDYCENKLGFNSEYNILTDSCECSYGYELSIKEIGTGYECVSCLAKYGLHSRYNSFTKKCECDKGYTLRDGECKEKQNNVYFILEEIDVDERKAIIKSEYDHRYYLVEYGYGCYDLTIERYVGDKIVVNLGTDFDVDIGDKIVLQDDDELCDILDVEWIDSDFTLNNEGDNNISYHSFTTTPITTIQENNYKPNNRVEGIKDYFLAREKNLVKSIDKNLTRRLKGNILLQVEENGEGWYVNPDDEKKYYLGRPVDAFNIMRKLGLGAKHNFIVSHTIFPLHVVGKILIDVEDNGKAYYIYPQDKKAYYLGKPADAFKIMRSLGLGITNDDIRKIEVGE